ncbi:TolC family protein [Edaphobacter aggregans]|uniref:TolC family protein n=1 Tax=Edaphobacter aggregans TaxID=570835 RepID=UPI000555B3A6|nr:TolC family protein [Edaphobacter aggregans]
MISPLRLSIALLVLVLAEIPAVAQISFTTAVDLALKNSPRVKAAEAEAAKAQAVLEEMNAAYIPTLVGGSGLGYSYGFPVGQPSVVNVNSQSLIFNYSQQDYVRAARASLNAANLALRDVRQAVAEDAAITYLALDRDQQRQAALGDQNNYAARLVRIVQDRLDAGQDTPIDLTTARLTAAQIRLARLRAEDVTEADREHLARLTGLPAAGLSVVSSSIPELTPPATDDAPLGPMTSPAVESAYAVAKAKQQTAFGDDRYLWRPQIYFVAQYSRFSKINNYDLYYSNFQHNNAGIGIQITLPVFDAVHKAKARESAADAARAQHDAEAARDQFLEGRLRVRHVTAELAARAEVAGLDQQLAQQQLDVMLVELNAGTGNSSAQQMTPKDEQSSRIAEREKYLAYLEAGFQMKQAQINLMRQTGDLENWLKSAAQSQALDASKPQ